jgi:hypothetical protein
MQKFKIVLSRPERAFIFFSAQSFKPDLPISESPHLEGLRVMFTAVLQSIAAKNYDLFNTQEIACKFSLPEVCAIYQMSNDSFEYLNSAETITAARSIIWKTHKIMMNNENR